MYVALGRPGSVSVIDTATQRMVSTIALSHPGAPIALPTGITTNAAGTRAYVATVFAGLETLDLRTATVVATKASLGPAYGIAPGSARMAAFVLRNADGDGSDSSPAEVVPIDSGLVPHRGIPVGTGTDNIAAIATAPDGKHVYALLFQGRLVPIDTGTLAASTPLMVPGTADGTAWDVAISPDSRTAYVTVKWPAGVVKVDLVTGAVSAPILLGVDPHGIVITPDGRTAYITDQERVIPLDLATDIPGQSIQLAPSGRSQSPEAAGGPIAITADGHTLYAIDAIANSVTAIDVATQRPGRPIIVGHDPVALVVGP